MKINSIIIYLFILISILLLSNNNFICSINLIGKWNQKINDDCINSIYFKNDSTYLEYDCELDINFYGKYEISNNKVILLQEKGEYDEQFPINSEHRYGKERKELFIINNELIFSSEFDIYKKHLIEPFKLQK